MLCNYILIRHGKDNITIYHSEFKPLEWNFNLEEENNCYVKVIVDKHDKEKVLGFHILSPNAGEITQGIALAMKCGLTKNHLDKTVGIHPTIAEEYVLLNSIKGEDDGKKEGC